MNEIDYHLILKSIVAINIKSIIKIVKHLPKKMSHLEYFQFFIKNHLVKLVIVRCHFFFIRSFLSLNFQS